MVRGAGVKRTRERQTGRRTQFGSVSARWSNTCWSCSPSPPGFPKSATSAAVAASSLCHHVHIKRTSTQAKCTAISCTHVHLRTRQAIHNRHTDIGRNANNDCTLVTNGSIDARYRSSVSLSSGTGKCGSASWCANLHSHTHERIVHMQSVSRAQTPRTEQHMMTIRAEAETAARRTSTSRTATARWRMSERVEGAFARRITFA